MNDLFNLEGMNAIITGGGKGIGKSIAESFLEYGANVVITGSSEAIFEAEKEFIAKGLVKVHAVNMNLLDRKQRAISFDKCIEFLDGKLDILVNNAGLQKRIPIDDYTLEAWDDILEVNLTSAFDLSQRAVKIMRKNNYGKIINISSIGGLISSAKDIPAYQASKGGFIQLTKCFADEWSHLGIRSNSIAPGYAETSLTKQVCDNPQAYKKTSEKIPLGTWAKPNDFNGAAILLASHAGDYINGTTITVDGGVLCR